MHRNTVKTPTIWARINGANVDTVMHANFSNSGSCNSSRFELTISIRDNASDSQWPDLANGTSCVTIYMRNRPEDPDSVMFDGLADNIAINPINGTARIVGRDYSSVLISSTYQSSYCNQTASEIARAIAARHGFIPNISSTSTMVGSYQGNDHNQILLNVHSQVKSEWELLKHLARTEDCQMYVDGTTLVFAPADALPGSAWSIDVDDVMDLTFHLVCPTSDQTAITAKSWNSWLCQAFTSTDQKSTDQPGFSLSALDANPGTEMAMVRPNLTPQDVERLASQRLSVVNEQALTVQIVMPGEMSFSPGDVLTITSGLGVLDTDYVIKSVRRRFSSAGGFLQYVQGYAMPGDPTTFAASGSQAVG